MLKEVSASHLVLRFPWLCRVKSGAKCACMCVCLCVTSQEPKPAPPRTLQSTVVSEDKEQVQARYIYMHAKHQT